MHALPDQNAGRTLNPKALNQRRVLLLGLGAAAAIALLVARRGASAATPPATDPNATTGTAGDQGSTFADNGGQASALGNDVTSALGGFGLALGDLTTAVQGQSDALANLPSQLAATGATGTASATDPASPAATDASPAASPVTINIGAASGAGSPAGKTAQPFKTEIKRSPSTGKQTVYHVTPGHKPVPVRVATHAQPAKRTKGSPAGKPVAHAAHTPVSATRKKRTRR